MINLFTGSLVVQRLFQFYCFTIRTWSTCRDANMQSLLSNAVYVIKLQFSVSHGHKLEANWLKWRWTFFFFRHKVKSCTAEWTPKWISVGSKASVRCIRPQHSLRCARVNSFRKLGTAWWALVFMKSCLIFPIFQMYDDIRGTYAVDQSHTYVWYTQPDIN